MINFDDAWGDFCAFAKLMDVLQPLECDECGPINRKGNTLHIFTKEKKKLCSQCSLRLGLIKWHKKEKKYY